MRNTTLLWSRVAIACALVALAACHTVEGANQDVRATGRAMENTAERVVK